MRTYGLVRPNGSRVPCAYVRAFTPFFERSSRTATNSRLKWIVLIAAAALLCANAAYALDQRGKVVEEDGSESAEEIINFGALGDGLESGAKPEGEAKPEDEAKPEATGDDSDSSEAEDSSDAEDSEDSEESEDAEDESEDDEDFGEDE